MKDRGRPSNIELDRVAYGGRTPVRGTYARLALINLIESSFWEKTLGN